MNNVDLTHSHSVSLSLSLTHTHTYTFPFLPKDPFSLLLSKSRWFRQPSWKILMKISKDFPSIWRLSGMSSLNNENIIFLLKTSLIPTVATMWILNGKYHMVPRCFVSFSLSNFPTGFLLVVDFEWNSRKGNTRRKMFEVPSAKTKNQGRQVTV